VKATTCSLSTVLVVGLGVLSVRADLLHELDQEVVRLVKDVAPSVVTVVAESKGPTGLQRRIGSAVVLDDSGHVVTTASVVEGAERVRLKTHDGHVLVTVGVVVDPGPRPCGLSEVGEIRMNLRAAPGSSGGAVVNCEGETVGILTAAMGPGSPDLDVDADYFGGRLYGFLPQQDLGMSLAVPIESARRVAERLIRDGKVARGWLGIRIEERTQTSSQAGVVITSVLPGSPAERAKLRRGDAVISFEKQRTPDCATLKRLVADASEGTSVELEVARGGQVVPKTVELASVPEEMLRSLRAAGVSKLRDPVGQVRWWWRSPRDGEELRRQIEELEDVLGDLKLQLVRQQEKK
jgi:S1-C subfamily serine protease